VREYTGGYDDWLRQSQVEQNEPRSPQRPEEASAAGVDGSGKPNQNHRFNGKDGSRKLSYNEQRLLEAQKRELAEIPEHIEALEAEQARLTELMADPSFYQQDSEQIAAAANRLKELEDRLAQAYRRWEELEQKLG
jgi:ATP-binding cassette subfamily F protein uup